MPKSPRRQPQDLPQQDEVWHAFTTLLRTWINEPGKKPVRPYSLTVLDLTTGMVVSSDLTPGPTPDWVRDALFKAMTQPVRGIRPHRPKIITVPDLSMAAALSPALAEIGIECRQMDTPEEVHQVVRDMEKYLRHGEPEVPGLFSAADVTPEVARDLFAAAAEFYRAAPWVQLTNMQMLVVTTPAFQEPRYVTVMGNGGVEYGLSVSLSASGVEWMMSSGNPLQALPEHGLHSLLFNDILYTPFDDLEAADKYHWEVAAQDAYPVPIVIHRAGVVLRPNRAELVWYQAALRAIPIFVRDHLRPDGAGDYSPVEISISVPTSDGNVPVSIRYPSGLVDRTSAPVATMDWTDETDEDDEGEHPVFDRRSMEGQMAALASEAGGESGLSSPELQKAQNLMYQAWETQNPGRRIALAHQALAISSDCADAYVLLAEEEAHSLGKALEYYRLGVEAGERALKGSWEELIGAFWGVLETRPYMRAKQGLAQTLWRLGRKEEARAQYEELLRLNPGDNQGNRYALAELLLDTDRDADLRELIQQYDEPTASWLYTRALLEFRAGGAAKEASRALRDAFKHNPHVPPYLIGERRVPPQLPDYIGLGDENEAVDYAANHLNHWRRTPGAVDWLKEQWAARSAKAQARKSSKKGRTLEEVIESVVAEAQGPTPVDEVVARVLEQKPSKAKDPVKNVLRRLHDPYWKKSYVFLDPDTVIPVHLALHGIRFRIPLDRQMVSHGAIPIYPYWVPFLERDEETDTLALENEQGREIPGVMTTVRITLPGPFGEEKVDMPALDIKPWLAGVGARRGDSLLVTVLDWDTGRFQLAYEPERRRRKAEIEQQNRALADTLYSLLEVSRREELITDEGLQTAYARMPSARDYPGDHWTVVLDQDRRMEWDGDVIVLAEDDGSDLLDELEGRGEVEAVREKPFTPQQGKQVYRFRASRGKKVFIIEARGQDTLGDMDATMREAFDLDDMDHLSEFTLLTSRGKGNLPHREPLGPLDPAGEYPAHKVRLAGLSLQPGDKLEYLYDFGDEIRHSVVLEDIGQPKASAKYPRYREAGQGEGKRQSNKKDE